MDIKDIDTQKYTHKQVWQHTRKAQLIRDKKQKCHKSVKKFYKIV